MTNVMHTPRPWSVGDVRKRHVDPQPMHQVAVHVGTPDNRGNCLAIVYGGGPGATHSDAEAVEANAHLIAAAPELLAIAKQYAAECERCNGTREVPDYERCPTCGGSGRGSFAFFACATCAGTRTVEAATKACSDCAAVCIVIDSAEGKA